jgi:hypothetical protein
MVYSRPASQNVRPDDPATWFEGPVLVIEMTVTRKVVVAMRPDAIRTIVGLGGTDDADLVQRIFALGDFQGGTALSVLLPSAIPVNEDATYLKVDKITNVEAPTTQD